MLTAKETMDAVEQILLERFQDGPVYRNLTPRKYTRPSFLLGYGPSVMEDASAYTMLVTATVTITVFVPVDEYGNSHMDELQARAAGVQELFAVEGLRVGDRVLRVTRNTAMCNFDYAEVQVSLQYHDDRPAEGHSWPFVENVEMNIKEE